MGHGLCERRQRYRVGALRGGKKDCSRCSGQPFSRILEVGQAGSHILAADSELNTHVEAALVLR